MGTTLQGQWARRARSVAFWLAVALALTGLAVALTPSRAVDTSIHSSARFTDLARIKDADEHEPAVAGESEGPVRRGEPSFEEGPIPHSLPVAPGQARIPFLTTPPPGPAPTADPPTLGSSFQAIGDDISYIPPDTHGAVGPTHVMTTLNNLVRIHTRSGGTVSTATLQSFWSGVTSTAPFDPRVVYEPYSDRWITVAGADPAKAASAILLAVSATSDPTGTWYRYRFDADASNSTWCDYPTLGFNKDWIVVQCNMFTISGSFSGSKVFVFHKSNLYSNLSDTPTTTNLSGYGATHQPAVTYSNTLSTEYLMNSWNGDDGAGFGYVRIYSITAPSETVVAGPFVAVSSPWRYAGTTTDFAPQSGSSNKINTGDDRMQNLVYRNGSLWAAQTAWLPSGSPTRSAAQWWQVTPAGSVQQFGRVDDGSHHFAYPSIAVNQNGDAVLGYSRFGSSQFASANYSYRAASDPSSTMQADTVLKAGEASYYKTYSGTRNRWGDYSFSAVDPVNDTDFWTVQEYAWTPSLGYDRWSTWWGQLIVGPAAVSLSPTSLTYGSQNTGSQSSPQTVTVTNTGTGSLSVSSATFTGANPTEFNKSSDTCTGTPVAPGGTCTIGVRFAPAAGGSRSASLSIADNASGSPHTVALSGTGVAVPAVSISPATLAFGNQTVGYTSSAMTITVTNSGAAMLNVSSVAIGGTNPSDFAVFTDACTGAAVAPAAACAVQIKFIPSATGARGGTFSVASDAPGSPHSSSLSGNGIAPAPGITLTPANLSFPSRSVGTTSPAQTITVTNSGTANLTVSATTISGTNASNFAKVSDTCAGGTIVPAASCAVGITFSPSLGGSRTATLSFADNAAGSPHTAALSGVGVGVPVVSLSSSSLAFADRLVSTTSATQTVTLTNTGTDTLSVSTVSLVGANPGDFIKSGDGCGGTSVPVSGSCAMQVAFRPTAVGARSASLSIASNAPTSPNSVSLSGNGLPGAPAITTSPTTVAYGYVAVGVTSVSKRVTATNTGDIAAGPIALGLSGSGFAVTATTCSGVTLPLAGTCTIDMTFTPPGSGAQSGVLTITSNAPTKTVTLTGTGDGAPPQSSIDGSTLAIAGVSAVSGSMNDDLSGVSKGTLELRGIAFDHTYVLSLFCDAPARVCLWSFDVPLSVPPGRYTLNVAGTDATGNVEDPPASKLITIV